MFDERLYHPFVEEHGEIEPKDYWEFERKIKSAKGRKGEEVTQNA